MGGYMIPEKSSKSIFYTPLVLGIIGFLLSLYSLILHFKLKISPGGSQFCDISSNLNCSKVILSNLSELYHIPISAYGISYFSIIIILSLGSQYLKISKKCSSIFLFLLSSFGISTSLLLIYASYKYLDAQCLLCLSVHLLNFLLFLTSLRYLFKYKRNAFYLEKNAFKALISYIIIFGIIPLLCATLINTFIIPSLKKSSKAPTEVKTSSKIDLPINRSNYINDGEDYRIGSDNAKVVVQIFSDYGCIHCKNATEAILEAQKIYGMDKVLFVYRFFPISNKCNPNIKHEGFFESTCLLSIATRCAGQQKHFFEFRKWASQGISMSPIEKKKNLSKEGVLNFIRKLGLDNETFKDCLNSKDELYKIQRDANRAQELNIQGTPLIIINGKVYEGPNTTSAFLDYFRSLNVS